MYARGRHSHCRRNGVHRGRALEKPQGSTWSILGGLLPFFFPYSMAHESKKPGKKEAKKKENQQKERRRKVQKEKEGREDKEKKQKQRRPKDRIVPWEEMLENEWKGNEKENEREGRPTYAPLIKERLLRNMPSDELGVPPKAPRPALRPTGRPTGRRSARSRGEILGATVPQLCCSTPLFHSVLSVGVPTLHVVGGLVNRIKTPTLLIDGI